MRRPALIALLVFSVLAIGAAGSLAASLDEKSNDKITICHATGNGGYVQITISVNGLNGHEGHAEDTIPPNGSDPGRNWDSEGQAIWENGCVVPEPPTNPPERPIGVFGSAVCGSAGTYTATAIAAVVAALLLPAAVTAGPQGQAAQWAYLLRAVPARSAPSSRARVITVVRQATPEGESNLVRILGERRDASLQDWVRIDLAILPNRTTGWVPRDALGDIRTVHTELVVDRSRLTATLLRDGKEVFRAEVGIGTPGHPTPAGTFTVRERLAGFDDPFYGPVAFGTTARSPVLTDWPGARVHRDPRDRPSGPDSGSNSAQMHQPPQRRHPAPLRPHGAWDTGHDSLTPGGRFVAIRAS